jgi:hypothetical protein
MGSPEHDLAIERRLEAINQDENPIERERKLNAFYEELADREALAYEQGEEPPRPGERPLSRP